MLGHRGLIGRGFGIDAIIIDFPKAFDLVPHDRLLTKLTASGVGSRVVVWVRAFIVGRTQRGRVGGQLIKEGKLRYAARERFGSTTVSSVCK